ncbi:MAG: hypothetical protein HKN82_02045, partial [Akkermansiaceae bacterium]|nr:hypothetical protein [Akkermansiaceae bacterium]
LEEQVIRGEIDNRTRGQVTGRIWFAGRDHPVVLDLAGDPWRDLAGHILRFTNRQPAEEGVVRLAEEQEGVVGDMTASRRVKVPDCSPGDLEDLVSVGAEYPWHWGNALHLEWFSNRNGRVVIESSRFDLELDASPTWEMSNDEEAARRLANATTLTDAMDRLGAAFGGGDDFDDDAAQSAAEAEADAEAARMDLLLDRVTARLEREGHDEDQFTRILEEERERMRRERGEPNVELTPEEEAERSAWIEEMNTDLEESGAGLESETWKGETLEGRQHPVVERCCELGIRIHQDVEDGGWIPVHAQREHPVIEIVSAAMAASAKLAGALDGEEEWPPPKLFAGQILVRMKKGRDYLRDVIRGLDSADEDDLAPILWRAEVRREIGEILGEVQRLIMDVREVLSREAG